MSRIDYWASDSVQEMVLEKARDLYSIGKYNEALGVYQGLMTSGVDSDIYFEAGNCHYRLGNFAQAIPLYESSVQLNNRRHSAFINLGFCYKKINNIPKSIYNYSLARTLKPDDAKTCLTLGQLYSALNKNFESVYYYNKFLNYSKDKREENYRSISRTLADGRSNSERAFYGASRAFSRKELLSAKDGFQTAVNNYPINYDANFNLARVSHDLGNYSDAIKYFTRALFLNSSDNKLYMYITSGYSLIRDYTRAYCFIKRYLNTLIAAPNQSEYLNAMKNLSALEPHADAAKIVNPERLIEANRYFDAFLEFENLTILGKDEAQTEYRLLETLTNPEVVLSKLYNKTGGELQSVGKFREANKFFSRVMEISAPNTEEYKFAKGRFTNV